MNHARLGLLCLLALVWCNEGRAATCGDGVTEAGEECDDGGFCAGNFDHLIHCTANTDCAGGSCRTASGDGCSATCIHETQPCDSDCNRDGTVTVDEVVRSIGIALGTAPAQSCSEADTNGDGAVTVNELLAGMDRALTRWQTARVDIGGYGLRIYCVGSGSPTVVLDSGLGDDFSVWNHVQPQVANVTRVCAFNRAGLGNNRNASDPGPLPRTGMQMVGELHTLLRNSCLPGPYVLTGHSLGGLNTRLYAATYPEDVAGIVLVDAPHEDYGMRLQAILPPETWALFTAQQEAFRSSQPPNVQAESMSLDETLAEVRASGPLPQVPMIVLIHGLPAPSDYEVFTPAQIEAEQALWRESEAEIAGLIPGSEQILATQSGHYIQVDQPSLVVDAIKSVVAKVRGKQ